MSLELTTHQALEAAVQRAEDHWRRGAWTAALDAYAEILTRRLALKVELTAADLVVVDRVADLASLFGQSEAADNLLAGSVSLLRAAGNQNGANYTLLKRVDLALGRGKWENALGQLRELEPVVGPLTEIPLAGDLSAWEKTCAWPGASAPDRSLLFTLLYLCLGRVLTMLGQYGQAQAAVRRGLTRARAQGVPHLSRQALPHLHLALASALLEQGALADAHSFLRELERELKAARQPGFVVRWHELSGKLALVRGRLGAALEHFEEALRICRERGFGRAELGAALNLAEVQIILNQTSAARETLTRVSDVAASLEEKTLQARAEFLLRTAVARGRSTITGVPLVATVSEMWHPEPDATAVHSPDDLEPPEIPASDNYLALFEDRTLEFYWHLGWRDWAGAASVLQTLEDTFTVSDSKLIAARLQFLRGLWAYYQQAYDQAERILWPLIEDFGALELRPDLWQTLRVLGWCSARLNQPAGVRDELARQAQEVLDVMTGTLDTEDRAIFLLNKWTAEEEDLAGATNRLAQLQERRQRAGWLRRPWLRWQLWRELHDLLTRTDRYRAATARRRLNNAATATAGEAVAPLTLWQRLWRHPRDRVTLSFLVLPDRLLVVRTGWMRLAFGISPVTRLEIRELVRRWHLLVRRINRGRGSAAPKAESPEGAAQINFAQRNLTFEPGSVEELSKECDLIAEQVARVLQIPSTLKDLPKRVRALTFVADDGLHGFPFAAIKCAGEYLIERFSLAHAFVSSDEKSPDNAADGKNALLVNVARGTHKIPPLPGTGTEITEVRDLLAQNGLEVCSLADDTASKSTILKELPHASLFHIACHGVFKRDHPDNSGLVLIPEPDTVEILSFRELSETRMARIQHVTLSSCWSADNFILPGRWIISLPETFWRAGAQSILGCLWEVNDMCAVAFMKSYYQKLKDVPRDKALQETQLACLRGQLFDRNGNDELSDSTGMDTSAPIYWAGFNLYGDCRQLRF